MVKQIRIRSGVAVIDRGADIYVGHLQRNLIFNDRDVILILRQLREWITCEKLLKSNTDQPGMIFEVITRLDEAGLIEKREYSANGLELIITHMNEVGTLLAPLLLQHGFSVSTLDSRSATAADVCGQFLRMSDIGESFKDVIVAQQRELRNSGKNANALGQSVVNSKKLVLVTSYPEPELLATMMADGYEYLCAMATPFGAVLGPRVKPGITPCFFCIELWRSELDDQWQKVAASIFMARNEPVPMSSALLTAAAAVEFLVPTIYSEIPHENLGTTYSLIFESGERPHSTPSITSANQRWAIHPECSCHWGR